MSKKCRIRLLFLKEEQWLIPKAGKIRDSTFLVFLYDPKLRELSYALTRVFFRQSFESFDVVFGEIPQPNPFFNNQRLAVRESWEADSPKVGMLQRDDVASGL